MNNRVKWLILHHTAGIARNPNYDSYNSTFEQVDAYHKSLWNFKSELGHFIGYQFFIEWSGKITQGRSETETGAHTIGQNNNSIGICLAGNFSRIGEHNLPSREQQESLRNLLISLMKKQSINQE